MSLPEGVRAVERQVRGETYTVGRGYGLPPSFPSYPLWTVGEPMVQLPLPGLFGELCTEWRWTDEEEIPMQFEHKTVMLQEIVAALAPRPGGVYVDATVGGGGHAEGILQASPDVQMIGLDRDPIALEAARVRLAPFGARVTLVAAPFGTLQEVLQSRGIQEIHGVVADLGVSSPQLEDPARGMSFRRPGPIDMRMDPSSGSTAYDLIARLSDSDLADVLFRYGEERRSRRIARSIKKAYEASELLTTLDLRRAVVRAVGPARIGGIDPATRTFQALRIAVNRELDELAAFLQQLPDVLVPGGVAAVLSFHSLEDRLVKGAFQAKDSWMRLTKKPCMATEEEVACNPRARSAKLRTAKRQALSSGLAG